MFARDDAGLKEEATNLGMGKVWKLLPVILIFRMPGSKRSLTGTLSSILLPVFNP